MKVLTKSKRCGETQNRMRFHREVNRILHRENQQNSEVLNLINPVNSTRIRRNADVSTENSSTQNSQEELRNWSLKYNIAKRAVNELLKILKNSGLKWLPNDSRTLCKTPRSTNVIQLAGGKYWYNGIKNNLQRIFSNLEKSTIIQLNFNVDGVPLFKSSNTQFWPILANIHSSDEMYDEIEIK